VLQKVGYPFAYQARNQTEFTQGYFAITSTMRLMEANEEVEAAQREYDIAAQENAQAQAELRAAVNEVIAKSNG
jgi:hypothetical protein